MCAFVYYLTKCSLLLQFNQNMSEAKQPKPFLKRGTRQYLSNATVRSLNQKPKIVDFGADEADPEPQMAITNPTKNASFDFKVEIKVNNKPKPKKQPQAKATNVPAKQNKNLNQEKLNNEVAIPNKKKATAMDDYIVAKDNKRQSGSRQKPVKVLVQPKISMVSALKRQEQHLSDDSEEEPIQQPKPLKHPVMPSMPSSSKNQQISTVSNAKKKAYDVELDEPAEQINFNSDSEEEVRETKAKNKKPQIFPKPIEKKSRWDDEEPQEKPALEEPKGPSKILQKFYKKEAEVPASKISISEKKPTAADISRELKQQIFNELLAQKHSDFIKKLDQLQASIVKSKKERESLEQSSKQLVKDREQFEREMERRRKEFQEKVNAQNNKLTREKRYLKDHQTNGKVDWRVKNDIEEIRSKLEQSQAEKKKMKTTYTQEIDRLKKKLEEQEQETEVLKGQIRCIQMEKIELKTKAKQPEKKNEVVRTENEITRYWQDAPNHSYVSNFLEDNFSLISLDPEYYNYQNLEYYIYYCSKRDELVELISEQRNSRSAKITRKYQNGKEQVEYISQLVKETFPVPFKFTVVHYLHGDIKMILPEGIHIYFDHRNQITEWRINPDKVIYNFHRQGQIEMKFKHRRLGEIKECYKDGQLIRNQGGDQIKFRRGDRGDIVRE